MSEYKLDFTDVNLSPIIVDEKDVDTDSVDITLFGFKRLNYGEELNENFVHLLENFAAPEDPLNPGNPDISQTNYISSDNTSKLLEPGKQITGQIWYNKTDLTPYVFYNGTWNKLETQGDEISANWGQILNGEQIPRPVSISGYIFPYSECSWIVSPFNQLNELEEMVCRTDENAIVTMEYLFSGDSTETSAIANYMIVGIRGNNNLGSIQTPQVPVPTPTPSPSTSVGGPSQPAPTNTPTPTPAESETAIEPVTLTILDPYFAFCSDDLSCTASYPVSIGTDYTVSGGSGDFSYNWAYSNGANFTISNTNVASPVLSRNLSTGLSVTGYGTLTITDNQTNQTASKQFTFTTTHSEIPIPDPSDTPIPDPSDTPTPTPSNSENAPDPSNTPTPTPSNSEIAPDPSNTPTPTPSESSLPPLSVNGASSFIQAFCPDSAGVASATLTVSGGSGDYTITAGTCTTDAFNLGTSDPCTIVSISIDNAAGTATASLSSISSTVCPNTSLRRLTQTFNVVDNQTSETGSGSVQLEQEIAGGNNN